MSLGFEEVVEEELSEEGRRPATSSEDSDGPKTARGAPIVHLSRYKSCGDIISTSGLNGDKKVGESAQGLGLLNFKVLQE